MNKDRIITIACSSTAGLAIGFIFGKFLRPKPKKEEILGRLRIDNSDPDNPDSMFLELAVPVSYIYSKKVVRFEVLKEDYLRK